jgi:hypothetical protein
MMKKRCGDKDGTRPGYANIGYCKKWETFSGFYEDMKDGYADNLSIDRIENSKGYSKSNCRWSTKRVQVLNRNCAIRVTIDGITKPLADWCIEKDLRYDTIRARIKRYGWKAEDALKAAIVNGGKRKPYVR